MDGWPAQLLGLWRFDIMMRIEVVAGCNASNFFQFYVPQTLPFSNLYLIESNTFNFLNISN